MEKNKKLVEVKRKRMDSISESEHVLQHNLRASLPATKRANRDPVSFIYKFAFCKFCERWCDRLRVSKERDHM